MGCTTLAGYLLEVVCAEGMVHARELLCRRCFLWDGGLMEAVCAAIFATELEIGRRKVVHVQTAVLALRCLRA